ncbi:class I SAM-dependent methyltransferase [candidate division KSB1 bacterium]|nr:class I SAM-dependent methyltransferase [candidate division KSB1 bacterium]
MSGLSSFFALNRRWSNAIGDATVLRRSHLYFEYPRVVGEWLAQQRDITIVDVGAGRSCPFAESVVPGAGVRVIGVDISDEEMAENTALHERIVADVTKRLPFTDHSVDAVVSRSVLEHLEDVERFCAEAARVLKPGGMFIHFLPNKFALFALVNQALPMRFAKGALHFFWEDSRGICGFPAVYDRCYPSALARILIRRGFEHIDVRTSWYQAFYFAFFLPLFLVFLLYDSILHLLKVRPLAAFLLVTARTLATPPAGTSDRT